MSESLAIMIVDDHPERAGAVAAALQAEGHRVVGSVSSCDYLPTRVRELAPDLILIDIDAPNRDTLEQVGAVHRDMPRPAIMFSACADPKLIQQAVRAGVVVYPLAPLAGQALAPILHTALAQFEHHQQLRRERDEARGQLEERRLLQQAKEALMSRRGLTEPQAHRLIQKSAMDSKRRLADVARDLLASGSALAALMEIVP
jgi:response regulator NasT